MEEKLMWKVAVLVEGRFDEYTYQPQWTWNDRPLLRYKTFDSQYVQKNAQIVVLPGTRSTSRKWFHTPDKRQKIIEIEGSDTMEKAFYMIPSSIRSQNQSPVTLQESKSERIIPPRKLNFRDNGRFRKVKKKIITDEKTQKRIDFYNEYKNFYNESRSLTRDEKNDSPNILYFKSWERQQLMPAGLGIYRTFDNQMAIGGLSLGNKYTKALSSSLRSLQGGLEKVQIQDNRLTSAGVGKVISHLDPRIIQQVDISGNNLGPQAFDQINRILNESPTISKLNLDKCALWRLSIKRLSKGLYENTKLRYLSLANNRINDKTAKYIAKIIENTNTIRRLDLNYNNIRGTGSQQIFEALRHNQCILELDFSWNSLGGQIDTATDAFTSFLANNTTLKHLDISYNRFTLEECAIIAEGLKVNKTILGIHLEGNNCYYDTRGYMIPETKDALLENAIHAGRLFGRKISNSKNWWICERWCTVAIEWVPLELDSSIAHIDTHDPVFLHMNIDNYSPTFVPLDEKTRQHKIVRAIPSNIKPRFIFSQGGQMKMWQNYEMMNLKQPIDMTVSFSKSVSIPFRTFILQTNTTNPKKCTVKKKFKALPRQNHIYEDTYDVNKGEWSRESSIFKGSLITYEQLTKSCIWDFKKSRLDKLIQNSDEITKIQEMIWKNFKIILDVYIKLWSDSPKENHKIYCSYVDLRQLLWDMNVIDDILFQNEDFEAILRNTKQTDMNMLGLVRFEFVECLLRIAIEKYKNRGSVLTESEAVELFIDEISPKFLGLDTWLKERYITQKMDALIQQYLLLFTSWYEKCKKLEKRKEVGTITFAGFRKLWNETHLFYRQDSNVADLYAWYIKSIVPSKEEVTNEKSLNMSFMEFFQAFCRALDLSSTLPALKSGMTDWYEPEVDVSNWTLEQKLEYVIPVLLLVLNKEVTAKLSLAIPSGSRNKIMMLKSLKSVESQANLN